MKLEKIIPNRLAFVKNLTEEDKRHYLSEARCMLEVLVKNPLIASVDIIMWDEIEDMYALEMQRKESAGDFSAWETAE